VLNQAPFLEYVWGSKDTALCIPNLSIRWRSVVSFTAWHLYY